LTETFAIWSMTALAAYEYILTVNQEVAMIWRRKWTLVTWLFVTNRYIMIAVIIWGVSPDTAQYLFKIAKVIFTVDPVFGAYCGNDTGNISASTNFKLTPILISRFLLNLRQLGEPENETQSRFNSRVSIPGFRVPTLESVVGNMGADLDHGPTKEVDEGADIPVNGGHLAEAALNGISENGPGVLVTENVYGNQELPSHMA
ncbi:hypothetical protein PHLCEN_2v4968, partial [Hermanssonia centrifuga]